eukprot:3258066-Rhodomonas_salina.1
MPRTSREMLARSAAPVAEVDETPLRRRAINHDRHVHCRVWKHNAGGQVSTGHGSSGEKGVQGQTRAAGRVVLGCI